MPPDDIVTTRPGDAARNAGSNDEFVGHRPYLVELGHVGACNAQLARAGTVDDVGADTCGFPCIAT
jgi:hypothetical protein